MQFTYYGHACFAVEISGKKILFDPFITGNDMQLIPRYAKLDFAVLSVGDNFTMGVEDAIVAAEFIQCKKIIGVHFDTFGYIRIDHDASRKQFEDAGLELTLPDIGATIDV